MPDIKRVNWPTSARHLVFVIVVCAGIGYLISNTALAIAAGLVCHSLWSMVQMARLEKWLLHPAGTEPPESRGYWGQLFDKIYRMHKRERRARRELQAIINRAQDSANSLSDGFVTIDNHGALEWWNRAASQLIGLRYPDDIKQQITHLFRNPMFKTYFESQDYAEPLLVDSPATPAKLQIHITLFGKNERLLLVRDVSRLQHLEQMRTDFVANVSHELRTPLTVLKGYLETFVSISDELPKSMQLGLVRMSEQSARMEALVQDLLLLSTLESNAFKLDTEPVKVYPLLSSIHDEAMSMNQEKCHSITVTCPKDMTLAGSRRELYSAFSNLVTNAIKYTPPKGEIHIKARYDDQNGIEIAVTDNGDGIDEEHIPRLTERFYRADQSRATTTGGTGLGLAIVKHVLLRHGAQLSISSTYGQGSCFSCQFSSQPHIASASSDLSPHNEKSVDPVNP